MAPMFTAPSAAIIRRGAALPLAGGVGAGHLAFAPDGSFRQWRIQPGLPVHDIPVWADAFHLWTRRRGDVSAVTLLDAGESPWPQRLAAPPAQHALFPCAWRNYAPCRLPLDVETVAFSPFVPASTVECTLPLYVIAWRLRNLGTETVEAALMLTFGCGWPEQVATPTFDFQQDNLCLTGALGPAESPNRIGIAVPDLHSEGVYLQGIEPWDTRHGPAELWEDFASDGELDPAVPRGDALGAAAWLRFNLEPGQTVEAPFIVAWHFPYYEEGPFQGQPRRYTRYLGKRRPDNAVVWLAEQAVQNYGAETANYRYWLREISDWHRTTLQHPTGAADIDAAGAYLQSPAYWTADGAFQGEPHMPALVTQLAPELGPVESRESRVDSAGA